MLILLPRKPSLQKVNQYVPNCLEVISARKLLSQMGMDRRVIRRACERFFIAGLNMLLQIFIIVALGETHIHQLNDARLVTDSN